jgi:uncharacterized membrane protein
VSSFLHYFLLFFIYSVLGWLVETTSIFITSKKLANRGFLIGPYCPIYGFGSITMILYLSGYRDNILTVFLLGAIICSILEYITSYLMERLFKARWWDYSNMKFNLDGRICLQNTVLFGLLGVLLVYIINPFISRVIKLISPTIILIITIIFLLIFITDTIISCNVTKRLRDTFQYAYERKDNTKEIKENVYNFLKDNHRLFQKRILKSFPTIKIYNTNLTSIKNNKKKIIQK